MVADLDPSIEEHPVRTVVDDADVAVGVRRARRDGGGEGVRGVFFFFRTAGARALV